MAKNKTTPSIAKLRKLAEITIEIEPEDIPYEGNASAIDEESDRETNEWIRAQLASGNQWAWCTVKVTATYDGAEGADYLGGCSYESRAAFVAPGGYYDDMVSKALTRLREVLIERARQWVTVKVDAAGLPVEVVDKVLASFQRAIRFRGISPRRVRVERAS